MGVRGCMCVSVCLCDPIGLHHKLVVFYLISVGFVAATVFCSAKAQFWIISKAILIPKIYAKLQEIAFNFSKFSVGGPQTPPPALAPSALCSGFHPLPGPLSKIPGSAPNYVPVAFLLKCEHRSSGTCYSLFVIYLKHPNKVFLPL